MVNQNMISTFSLTCFHQLIEHLFFVFNLGHIEIIKILVDNGADVTLREGNHGHTALYYASVEGIFLPTVHQSNVF